MAWSYTSLTAFETCPRRYYHTRVAKDVADPPGTEALWGNQVHEALEHRLQGTPLPPLLGNFEPYAAKVEAIPGELSVERKVSISQGMQETTWFAPDVWCRGIFDVVIDQGKKGVVLLDWKTGRRKPDSSQLELFAALAHTVYPKAETFKTMFIWLKEKKADSASYTAGQIPGIWTKFMRRVSKLEAAHESSVFPVKPSGLCRKYCPVKSCEFCGG